MTCYVLNLTVIWVTPSKYYKFTKSHDKIFLARLHIGVKILTLKLLPELCAMVADLLNFVSTPYGTS